MIKFIPFMILSLLSLQAQTNHTNQTQVQINQRFYWSSIHGRTSDLYFSLTRTRDGRFLIQPGEQTRIGFVPGDMNTFVEHASAWTTETDSQWVEQGQVFILEHVPSADFGWVRFDSVTQDQSAYNITVMDRHGVGNFSQDDVVMDVISPFFGDEFRTHEDRVHLRGRVSYIDSEATLHYTFNGHTISQVQENRNWEIMVSLQEGINELEVEIRTDQGTARKSIQLTLLGDEDPIPIRDPALHDDLMVWFDRNNDGQISLEEAQLDFGWLRFSNQDIRDFSVLTYFQGLRDIQIWRAITREIKLENMPNLQRFTLRNSIIDHLDLSNLGLERITLYYCEINEIRMNDVEQMEYASFEKTPMTRRFPQDLLPNLTYLKMSGSGVTPIWYPNMPSLKTLDISDNNMTGTLSVGVSGLEMLYCSRNKLTNLDLRNIPNLKTLSAAYNQIQSLQLHPEARIEDLNLKNNNLSQLPSFHYSALQKVDMEQNNLASFPLEEMPELRELNLSSNEIRQLDFSNAASLQSVNLNRNLLENLHLGDLPDLEELRVSENQLQELVLGQHQLVELHVSDNQLRTLPNLGDSLETLNCGHNRLQSLPALPETLEDLKCRSNYLQELTQLPDALRYIGAELNQISYIDQLPSQLLGLYISVNKLETLPPLPENLNSLFIHSNRLQSLPEFPSSLRRLYAWSNQIKSLPELPLGLRTLSVYDNQLELIPDLPASITDLDVHDNLLMSLPNLDHTEIYVMNVSGNNLSQLPPLPNNMRHLWAVNCGLQTLPVAEDMPFIMDLSENPLELSCGEILQFVKENEIVQLYPFAEGYEQDCPITPDTVLLKALLEFDTNQNDMLEEEERSVVYALSIDNYRGPLLRSFAGLHQFPNLSDLEFRGLQHELDWSLLPPSTYNLEIHSPKMRSMAIGDLKNLTYCNVQFGSVDNVLFYRNPTLITLKLQHTEVRKVNIKDSPNLRNLVLRNNKLDYIPQIFEQTNLEMVDLSYNQLADPFPLFELVEQNPRIHALDLRQNNFDQNDCPLLFELIATLPFVDYQSQRGTRLDCEN